VVWRRTYAHPTRVIFSEGDANSASAQLLQLC
jgi:hypothetical protein